MIKIKISYSKPNEAADVIDAIGKSVRICRIKCPGKKGDYNRMYIDAERKRSEREA